MAVTGFTILAVIVFILLAVVQVYWLVGSSLVADIDRTRTAELELAEKFQASKSKFQAADLKDTDLYTKTQTVIKSRVTSKTEQAAATKELESLQEQREPLRLEAESAKADQDDESARYKEAEDDIGAYYSGGSANFRARWPHGPQNV